MALMRKPGLRRNPGDRQFALPQKGLRAVHATFDHVLMNRQANRLAKRGFQVRHADVRDGGDLLERQILGQIFLNISEHAFQPGQPASRPAGRGTGGMIRQQVFGYRYAEAVQIEVSGGPPSPHRLTEQLQRAVANLESIVDFDGWIFYVQQHYIVPLFHFPAGRNPGGNNVDIAMNAETAVAPWAAAAMDVDRRADVDHDDRMIAGGDFYDSGRVRTKARAGVHDSSVKRLCGARTPACRVETRLDTVR